MGIFDDEDIAVSLDEIEEHKNPYLTESKKGMELIAKLLPRTRKFNESQRVAKHLDEMLDKQIMSTLREVKLNDALGLSQQLMKLSDQIMEYQKIRLLMGKTIIGIGGQFSAGKSCFINSLLQSNDDEILLPENQNPTTSIPTYIVVGEKQELYAYTDDRKVPLDTEAMQAMTHEFYSAYKIGFSRFVNNLVIHTPAFPTILSNRAAILDTPGYNKADTATRESLSDGHLASEHLKAADFLIWLVDIDNGIIKDYDIRFIQELELNTPVLIVFNKADKKPESDCRSIIEETAQVLKQKKLNIFGVTAYSARDTEEYFGNGLINKFMQTVVNYSAQKQDVGKTLKNLINSVENAFNENIRETNERQKNLRHYISNAEDILSIHSLVNLHNRNITHIKHLRTDKKKFDNIKYSIHNEFERLTR